MKTIEVVAAVIKNENKILATQRGYGEFKGMWEFPGGKIEEGENQIDALKREIEEELNTDIVVNEFITTVNYDYPTFHLIMHCYFCEATNEITLIEHMDSRWVLENELDQINWLPADIDVINSIKEIKKGTRILK